MRLTRTRLLQWIGLIASLYMLGPAWQTLFATGGPVEAITTGFGVSGQIFGQSSAFQPILRALFSLLPLTLMYIMLMPLLGPLVNKVKTYNRRRKVTRARRQRRSRGGGGDRQPAPQVFALRR